MPAAIFSTNHSHKTELKAKPAVAITGTRAASHSVGRRPRRWVMAEANGVIKKIPSQALAANRPAMAVDSPSAFRRRISSGVSMK